MTQHPTDSTDSPDPRNPGEAPNRSSAGNPAEPWTSRTRRASMKT